MRISVLIDSCNHHEFIVATIESILRQSRPVDEIIVSDDGSTDDTCEVIRRTFGDRVKIAGRTRLPGKTHLARQAASVARAFFQSTGDLVFLLDGDDVFLPHRIERYAAIFEANPEVVMVQSPLQHIDIAGNPLPSFCADFPASDDLLRDVYRQRDLNCFYSTSALAFRRSFLRRSLPLDVSDGLEIWLDNRLCIAALLTGRVVSLADSTGCWRRHTHSISLELFKHRSYLPRLTVDRASYFERCRAGTPAKPLHPWLQARFIVHWIRCKMSLGRSEEREPLAAHLSDEAVPSGRLALIVDDRLRDSRGHQLGFVAGMAGWLAGRGLEVNILAHQDFRGDLEMPHVELNRHFTVSWLQAFLRASSRTRVLAVLVHNARFLRELLRAKRARSASLVIASEATMMHLLAWWVWLAVTPRHHRLLLVFIYPPWMLAPSPEDGSAQPKRQARLYRWFLSLMNGSLRSGRCRLAADSNAIAEYLRDGGKRSVADVLVPVTERQIALWESPPPPATEGLRLGVLGRSVPERGFARVLAAIEAWCARGDQAQPVRFVVQWSPDLSARDEDHLKLQQLVREFPEIIEVRESELESDAYNRLETSLHGAIVAHERAIYANRTSNVVIEMVCAGRPFVTTAGTWMEAEMKARGAGVACGESPDDILQAIEDFTVNYERYARDAWERRIAARHYYSWSRFFDLTGFLPELRPLSA